MIAINPEVEKLLKSGFIYPISQKEWVSNIILVDKKQGKIHVCTYFRDLNKACPKKTYPMPFIDHIIDVCAGSDVFSLWMFFQAITRSRSNLKPNKKLPSFVHGVHLKTKRLPFA